MRNDEDIRFTRGIYGKTVFNAFCTGGVRDQVYGFLRACFGTFKTQNAPGMVQVKLQRLNFNGLSHDDKFFHIFFISLLMVEYGAHSVMVIPWIMAPVT